MAETDENNLTAEEIYSMIADFAELSESAKYPPFSVSRVPNQLLEALNREFEDVVLRGKSYDSFDKVKEEFAEGIAEARAWSKLFDTPKDAAIEYLRRSYEKLGGDPKSTLAMARGMHERLGRAYDSSKIIPPLAEHMGFGQYESQDE